MIGLAVSCIPIVGILVGFPCILFALLTPFVSCISGLKQGAGKGDKLVIYGKCPYCTGRLSVTVAVDSIERYVGVDCPLCRKRFLTKGKAFLRVPTSPLIKTESIL
jgi:DNA-directed RNA polymerase subunit RPC12/RpoP